MNGSRNTNRKRKNRHRCLVMLILPTLAATLLVQVGVGQQAAGPDVGGLRQECDFSGRQRPWEIRDTRLRTPPAPRLPGGSPTPLTSPMQMQSRIASETERSLPSNLPDLSLGSALGHNIPRGQRPQGGTTRLVRLPSILQSLGRVLAPAPSTNAGEEAAPPGHKIPFSTEPHSGEIELSTRNGLISLVARETPLNEILSNIAQSERLNVVCADNIVTPISITLYDVTLEDALTAVLSTAGYTWVCRNGIIQVTNTSDGATLSPEAQGRSTEVFPLDYASSSDVDLVVKGLLSPAGQSFPIQASATDLRKTKEAVVVEDLPGYLGKIREYICQADQPPRQHNQARCDRDRSYPYVD